MTSNQEEAAAFDWDEFYKIYLKWELWGLFALLTPIAALVMMILKIPA